MILFQRNRMTLFRGFCFENIKKRENKAVQFRYIRQMPDFAQNKVAQFRYGPFQVLERIWKGLAATFIASFL